MVLMVPRSHTVLRLQYQQVPAYLYRTTIFGFATSRPKLTITVEAVVITKGGLYETKTALGL